MAEELRLDIVSVAHSKGLTDAARDLKATKTEADHLGQSLDKTSHEAFDFTADLEKTRAKVKELNAEFRRTGDTDVLKDLKKNRTILNDLERVRREAERLAPKAQDFMASLDFSSMASEARGALIVGGGALAVAMAPAIAGIVASAIVGAVGAGGVVGGAILASQDTRVQAAWAALGRGLMDELQPVGGAFVQPLIHAAGTFKTAFDQSGITDALKESAKLVDPLAQALAGFGRELGPGISEAIRGAGPTFDVLKRDLPEVGRSMSHLLGSMADSGPEAALAMHDLFGVLNDGMDSAGPAIEGLTKIYGLTRGLNDSVKSLTGAKIFGDIIPTFGALEVLGKILGGKVTPTLSTVAQTEEEVRRQTEDATKAVEDWRKAWEQANAEFEHSIDLQAAFKLDVLDVDDGLQKLADTFAENGHSLDDSTQAGRDNQRQLIAVAKEMRQMRDDMIAMGQTTESANAVLATNYQRLIDQAVAAGASEAAVRRLIDALFAVPAVSVSGAIHFDPNPSHAEGRLAAGGPASPFGTYLVGENGPELLQMGSAQGYVWPNTGGGGSRGGTTRVAIDLTLNGRALRSLLVDDALGRGNQQANISVAYP